MRQDRSISNNNEGRLACAPVRAAHSAKDFSGFFFDFFLFCLTGAAIFDNRHALLKKFDSARAAKPLSQPLSHKSKC